MSVDDRKNDQSNSSADLEPPNSENADVTKSSGPSSLEPTPKALEPEVTKAEGEKSSESTSGDIAENDVDHEDKDDQSIKSEGADEEDALFTTLEMKEEQEEAAHPHEQPSDAKAAPMLLQSALATGDVTMDDSGNGLTSPNQEEKKGESTSDAVEGVHVVQQRVR